MENKTDHTDYLNFVFGQLYVLKHLCAATIALHPYRKTILQLGNNVLDEAMKQNALETRRNGIKKDGTSYNVPVKRENKKILSFIKTAS